MIILGESLLHVIMNLAIIMDTPQVVNFFFYYFEQTLKFCAILSAQILRIMSGTCFSGYLHRLSG